MAKIIRGSLKAHIEQSFYDGTRIYITQEQENGKIAIAEPLTLRTLTDKDRSIQQPPTIQLMDDSAALLQSIVDQAWDMGVRPRYAREAAPEVSAMKHHLEDMRRLVFADGSGSRPDKAAHE